MARKFTLRDTSEGAEGNDSDIHMIDRRQFMRHSFNTAAGVITMAGLTSVGFAALLMGQSDSSGGDTAVRYWVPTGAEDSVWYGDKHLEPMTYQSFIDAASSSRRVCALKGCGRECLNAVYVPHEENKGSDLIQDKPRFQFMDGYTVDGKYVGSGYELDEDPKYEAFQFMII